MRFGTDAAISERPVPQPLEWRASDTVATWQFGGHPATE